MKKPAKKKPAPTPPPKYATEQAITDVYNSLVGISKRIGKVEADISEMRRTLVAESKDRQAEQAILYKRVQADQLTAASSMADNVAKAILSLGPLLKFADLLKAEAEAKAKDQEKLHQTKLLDAVNAIRRNFGMGIELPPDEQPVQSTRIRGTCAR